uniref:Uncharacterized protein n=1 Tax=Zonotrichia albicollis TaxID=44394 RepID=A0A8D2QA00_ZONAL
LQLQGLLLALLQAVLPVQSLNHPGRGEGRADAPTKLAGRDFQLLFLTGGTRVCWGKENWLAKGPLCHPSRDRDTKPSHTTCRSMGRSPAMIHPAAANLVHPWEGSPGASLIPRDPLCSPSCHSWADSSASIAAGETWLFPS